MAKEFLQVGSKEEIYSDFHTDLLPHPFNRQLIRKIDEDAVKQSIRNLVLTNKYERIRKPNIGGSITKYLFEPFSPLIQSEIKSTIESMVENYEPRAKILDVIVSDDTDSNSLYITVKFATITNAQPQQLEITLYRVR
jgi:phage baseplate assembly protein W